MRTVADCDRRIEALKVWLMSCIDIEDWHGVRDSAADIEVAIAKREVLIDRECEESSTSIQRWQGQFGVPDTAKTVLEQTDRSVFQRGGCVPGDAGIDRVSSIQGKTRIRGGG